MPKNFRLISYEYNDVPRQLHSEADFIRAVERGHITAETMLEIYPTEGAVRVSSAAESDIFLTLFPPFVPETETKKPARQSPTTVDMGVRPPRASVPVTPKTQAQPALSDPATVTEAEAYPLIPDPEIESPERSRRATGATDPQHLWGAGLLAAVILIFGYYAMLPSEQAAEPVSTSDSEEAAPVPAPPVDPEADLPEQSFYVVRDAFLRAGASKNATASIKLSRSEPITGKIVPGESDPLENWLKITQGIHTGRYIWAANLSDVTRSPLDTSVSGKLYLGEATQIRSEPSVGASFIMEKTSSNPVSLSIGSAISVMGLVNNEWAEITLERGGVGYVPRSVLSQDVMQAPTDSFVFAEDAVSEEPSELPLGKRILVSNKCPFTIHIAVAYPTPSGPFISKVDVEANRSSWLRDGGKDAYATSSLLYYTDILVDGTLKSGSSGKAFIYDGTRVTMPTAIVKPAANQDYYEVPFSCDDAKK